MHRIFPFFTIFNLLLLFLFLGYAFYFLNEPQWADLGSETGAFERLSAIVFVIIGGLGLMLFNKTRKKIDLIFVGLMFAAAAREADLHRVWTTDSILKLRFYTGDASPIHEKIIGGIVIAFLLYAAWQLLKHVPHFFYSLKNKIYEAWAIFFALGFLTVAKMIDAMARLFPFMTDFHNENRLFLTVVEESFEMTGALFFLGYIILRLTIYRRVV